MASEKQRTGTEHGEEEVLEQIQSTNSRLHGHPESLRSVLMFRHLSSQSG